MARRFNGAQVETLLPGSSEKLRAFDRVPAETNFRFRTRTELRRVPRRYSDPVKPLGVANIRSKGSIGNGTIFIAHPLKNNRNSRLEMVTIAVESTVSNRRRKH